MKVNPAALQQILQAYDPKTKGAAGAQQGDATQSSQPGDEITLSAQGQELQRMIQAAQNAEDVRAGRIDEIRTQLRTGQYLIDPQQIANKMLGLGGGQ